MPHNRKMVTGNSVFIRKMNRSLILKTIIENKSISRSGLEAQTSLALPTIMRIVSILIEEGLVVEVGKGDSSGGRKPTMLEMKSDCMYFIGVSVQRVTHVILTDVSGNIISGYHCDTTYDAKLESLLKQILEGIDIVISQSKVDPSKIKYAGIGIPGTKFKHEITSIDFPFYNAWADFDPLEWKESGKFPCPVEFENVAKLGALGEFLFGAAKNCSNFIYIFADCGIGAGIVADGKLFTGVNGVAGEFGHTVVELNGRICYCGNKGCLEMYCSSSSLINRFILDEQGDPVLKRKLRDTPDFSIFTSSAYSGDQAALKYIEESANVLGLGAAGLINMFNPPLVIIGGELPQKCPGYTEIVARSAKTAIFRECANKLSIISGSLNDKATVRGAAALAMAQVFDHVRLN
ncbi:MAG: ROK family protein [Oscillospiraceae bacterium]|nr:ROK family protein [Oscillospiraceae bacterium]